MKNEEFSYIKAIQDGDSAGIKKIYQKFRPRIQHFITSKGGSLQDANDVFQDALVIIHRKVQSENFKLSSNFYTLLYGVCRNIWGNQLQKKSRTEVTLSEDYKYTYEPGISQLVEKQEETRVFWEAFKQLGQDCQQLLELFFAKVKMVDIVEQLGLSSVSYAKKRKFQCKERLVKLVKADNRYIELTNKAPTDGGVI